VAQLLIACGDRPQGEAGGVDAPVALTALDSAGQPVALSAMKQVAETTVEPDKLAVVPSTQLSAISVSQDAAAAVTADDGRPLDHTTNVLVLGSDRREGTPNWRTDVMMIVALDEAGGRAGVISIPRDIYIDVIPGHQPNKINVIDYLGEKDAPEGGGPALFASIIQEKMGIRIDHWVRFDFTGFIELVDALGGVEVDIDCAYYDYFQIEDVVLNVKPGLQRLSGDEALVYVRSRRLGGDLDRARRQQRFIWAIRNQVLNENILTRLPALYNAVSDSVQTDMGVVSALKVVRFAIGLDREEITGMVIGYPLVQQGYAGNMWIFKADWEAIRSEVQKVFDREPFIDTNTLVKCP
jgi:LCP family protein required for cell wall assembly